MYRDLLVTYVPLRRFWAERVASGHLPRWFPWEGLGQSFLGQGITGTFHPVNLLWLLFDEADALRVEIAGALLLGIVGQVLFARRSRQSAPAAVASAVALALSGYTLSMTSNPVYLRGLCTLPWVALAASALFTGPRPARAAVALGLTWALIPLGGDALSTLTAGAVVAALWVAHRAWARLGWALAAAGLMALLAAPELVPAALLRADSIVADFHNADFLARHWALHPERLPELLLPGLRTLAEGWERAQAVGEAGRWAESILLGALPVAMALTIPRHRVPLALLALALGSGWLALGIHGGLEPLLRHLLPALNTVRYPEKHLALTVFGVSAAAGFGVDAGLRAPRRALLSLGLVSLASVGAAFAAGSPGDHLGPLALALVTSAGFGAVTLLQARIPAAAWLVPLLFAASLWREPLGLVTLPAGELLAPTAALPGAQRVWSERGATTPPVDEASLQRWALEAEAVLAGNLSVLHRRAAFGMSANLPLAPRRERLLLGWALTDTRELGHLFGYDVEVPAEGAPRLVEAAPRAWLATPRFVPSTRELLARLRSDPRGARQHPLVLGPDATPAEAPAGEVRWTLDAIDELVLEAEVQRPAILVLNDLAAPGWTATVDGVPTPIGVANALVRAVPLQPGRHEVRFEYAVPGLRTGLALAALALLVALLLLGGRPQRAGRPSVGTASPSGTGTSTTAARPPRSTS